jgi:hypothetical protein
MMASVVLRWRWIAMAIAIAGCGGDDAQADQPDGPDCSVPGQPEPFVPDGVVQLNERCSARCPVIASAGDGFWVAWHEGEETMNRTRVRRLDASGAPTGSVYDFSGGCPAITHRNGITSVTFSADGIWLARFDDDGMAVGDPVLALPSGDRRHPPSVTASSEGYALVWAQDRSDYGPHDIYFAALDQEGAPVGEPRLLAAGEVGDESDHPFQNDITMYDGPAVATVPDGFVAVWYTRTTIEMHQLDSDGTDLGSPTSQPAHAPNRLYDQDLVEYTTRPLHLAASPTRLLSVWAVIESILLHVTEAAAPSLEAGTTSRFAVTVFGGNQLIMPTVSPDGFLAAWASRFPDESLGLSWVSLDQDGDQVGEIEQMRVDVNTNGDSVGVAHGPDGYVLVFENDYGNIYAMPLRM